MAGSCEHAGVVHGDPPHPKRDGDGGFAIALGRPGVNVPGAVVPLSLSSSDGTPFKGFMIGAVRVDGATGKETPIGGWDPRSMPDGAQVHPLCPDHATHDAYRSSNPSAEAIVPWIAGTDGMAVGDVVKFKATVVRSHSTWHAFETTFEVGSARGAGFAAIALERGRAPGSDDGGTSGVRAPGMAAATLGGWREPPAGTTEGGGQKMGKVVIDAKVAARRRRERSRKEREESRREDVQKAREILGGFGGSAVKAPTAEKPAVEAPTTDAAALVAAADRRRAARLWHGFSMAFAWLLLAPASAFVARHGRDAPTWFAFHRAASYCAAGVTATSAWYIVAARGWSTAWGRHGRVGAYVVVGVALQAIGGYARKRYPRRRWAAFHRALGFACIALGAYNCVAGARLLGALEAGTRSAKSAAISAAATWAATFAVMERARGRGRAGTIKLSHTV